MNNIQKDKLFNNDIDRNIDMMAVVEGNKIYDNILSHDHYTALQHHQHYRPNHNPQHHHLHQQSHLNSLSIENRCFATSSAGDEESYTCPQCFRTYRRHGTLRRHLRQECGKGKSMVCSVCGHRTKRADHLRQHVRKKHPEVAMRSLFRRAATTSVVPSTISTTTMATPSTSSLSITSSSLPSTKMRNTAVVATASLLQQQFQESVNVVAAAAVAMNLKAVANAAVSSKNYTEIVNLDDDDDDDDDDDVVDDEDDNDKTDDEDDVDDDDEYIGDIDDNNMTNNLNDLRSNNNNHGGNDGHHHNNNDNDYSSATANCVQGNLYQPN